MTLTASKTDPDFKTNNCIQYTGLSFSNKKSLNVGCISPHTAKLVKDMGIHDLLSHNVPGAWVALVIWAQDCVNNIFLTVLGQVAQLLCAQKLVTKDELYKSLGKVLKSPREGL